MSKNPRNQISDSLLEVLACPVCKAPVDPIEKGESDGLKCSDCGRIYPIREGIPVMLESEAIRTETKPEK